MKITYLAFARLPTERAHGIQIMKTCEALQSAGAEVTLMVPGRRTHIEEDPFSFYGIKHRFSLLRLNTLDTVRFGQIGFLISVLIFSEVAKWQRSFWTADIIYSRDSMVLLQYLFLGRKLVFELHRKPSRIDAFIARRAAVVIVINKALQDVLVHSGVPAERIAVAHDAADPLQTLLTREDLGMSNNTLIVYAGSDAPGKGSEVVRAAAPYVDGAVLCISGKSPAVTRHMLASADVVVVPNSAKYESSSKYTSPMKLFEALQSGARVVVSDVPAIREVVDERAVWFFTPDDPQSLAATVRDALNDGAAQDKLAAARVIAARYTWAARAKTIMAALAAAC